MKTLTPPIPGLLLFMTSCSLLLGAASTSLESDGIKPTPDGWKSMSPRDEIRPVFEFKPNGGPNRRGSLLIRADARDGLDGHWLKTFPVQGGHYYQFRAVRHLVNAPVPRRNVLARVLWRDDTGKAVLRDEPGATSYAGKEFPVAEPEYPTDHETDSAGWTEVADSYRAPSKATHAMVELYLRWAPRAEVEWSDISLTETSAPPARKVRLAAVHFRPSGKTSAGENCRLFAPVIEEAT